MNNPNNAEERAAKYLDVAKIHQDQLWKRRQIEMRTSFGLWAAMAVVAGFVYMHVNRPAPDSSLWLMVIYFIFFIFAIGAYASAVYLHYRHMRAIYISNEMDLDLMHYHINRADLELDSTIPILPKKLEYPSWVNKKHDELWKKGYCEEKKEKMKGFYPSVYVTLIIAILSILMYFSVFL